MILSSSALELDMKTNMNINNLIIDAAGNEILLTLIVDKNIYTCSHENSKINFEKIMILINNFLQKNKFLLSQISEIKHQDVPDLCKKFNIKKNLIKPIYLS